MLARVCRMTSEALELQTKKHKSWGRISFTTTTVSKKQLANNCSSTQKHSVPMWTQLTSVVAGDVEDHDQMERSHQAWLWRASAGNVSSGSSSQTRSLRCHKEHKRDLYQHVTTGAGCECSSCERQTCRRDIPGWLRPSDDASTSPDNFPNDAAPRTSHQQTAHLTVLQTEDLYKEWMACMSLLPTLSPFSAVILNHISFFSSINQSILVLI